MLTWEFNFKWSNENKYNRFYARVNDRVSNGVAPTVMRMFGQSEYFTLPFSN